MYSSAFDQSLNKLQIQEDDGDEDDMFAPGPSSSQPHSSTSSRVTTRTSGVSTGGRPSASGPTNRRPIGPTRPSRVVNAHKPGSYGDGATGGSLLRAPKKWSSENSREINTHIDDIQKQEKAHQGKPIESPKEKKFLSKVQKELEEQRREWKDEVDRLAGGSMPTSSNAPNSHTEGTNSFVDTSTGVAVFNAYVDVSGYRPEDISVTMDDLTNKVIIKASHGSGAGNITSSFTQKVPLPRFADYSRLVTKLNKKGIMRVEVPLIYYFPQEQRTNGKPTKSFVFEVRTNKDGTKVLEILVNTGKNVDARDLHVEVTEDNDLVISADTHADNGEQQRTLIKKYTLPPMAVTDKIRSKLGKDGRLRVLVPIQDKD